MKNRRDELIIIFIALATIFMLIMANCSDEIVQPTNPQDSPGDSMKFRIEK